MSEPEEVVKLERGVREKLLNDRLNSMVYRFEIGGHVGYLTAGLFPDGRVGEIFITFGKDKSTVGGLLDSFAIAVSVGLQYGVPLPVLVKKFSDMKFEPNGRTSNPEIRYVKSIMDYIFRLLELKFVPEAERIQKPATKEKTDAPPNDNTLACPDCGAVRVPLDGGRLKCLKCGTIRPE
jgi:ribonucleoside-diphosphate reductase alpha chain